MKKKFIILLILLLILIKPIEAHADIPPVSNTYKQGIYNISGFNKHKVAVELITPCDTALFVLNENKDVVLFLKMEYKERLYLKDIDYKATIGIVGDGDVVLIYE